MPRVRCFVLMSLAIVAVSACAATPAPSAGLRVLVQLARPLGDAGRIAEAAAHGSGKVATYLAASGGDWHALNLSCSDADDCEAALQRLRADRGRFLAVQRDERKRVVTP